MFNQDYLPHLGFACVSIWIFPFWNKNAFACLYAFMLCSGDDYRNFTLDIMICSWNYQCPAMDVPEKNNPALLLQMFCMVLKINLHPGVWTLQGSLHMILMLHFNVERVWFSGYEFKTWFQVLNYFWWFKNWFPTRSLMVSFGNECWHF